MLVGTIRVAADPLESKGTKGDTGLYKVGERVRVQSEAFLCTIVGTEPELKSSHK